MSELKYISFPDKVNDDEDINPFDEDILAAENINEIKEAVNNNANILLNVESSLLSKVDNSTFISDLGRIKSEAISTANDYTNDIITTALSSKVDNSTFNTFKDANTAAINLAKANALSGANSYTDGKINEVNVTLSGKLNQSEFDQFKVELNDSINLSINSINNRLNSLNQTVTEVNNKVYRNETYLSAKLLNMFDYTAFEVFAHDYVIPSGEVCNELGGLIAYEIPSSLTEEFIIYSSSILNPQEVVVDFGDGVAIDLVDITTNPTKTTYGYQYLISHTYESNGKYIIKVIGRKCDRIQSGSTIANNLICRVFEIDLPIASQLNVFSSFLKSNQHLVNVDILNSNFEKQAIGTGLMFNGCKNLRQVTGFLNNNSIDMCNNMFAGCSALLYTDFRIPPIISSAASIFHACQKLAVNVNDLLPRCGFVPYQTINLEKWFTGCKALTGTFDSSGLLDVRKKLWDNSDIDWVFPSNANYLPFIQCNAIRDYVPASWGGRASNDIIQPEGYRALKEALSKLSE